MASAANLPDDHDREVGTALDRMEKLVTADPGGGAGIWITELTNTATQLAWTIPELRSATARLAWVARKLGHPFPADFAPDLRDRTYYKVLLYICGQRFRFDFNFRGLKNYLRKHEESPEASDALVQSFDVFTKFGLRDQDAVPALNRVLELPDIDTRARHVCLAGLWAACSLPDQPTLLLNLANTMIGLGEADGTVYFRRATAYRLLRMPEQALDDIDHALSLLAPGNNEINQDYLRERQLIGLVAQLLGGPLK